MKTAYVVRLFDKQTDWVYNREVWVLLNWEVREEQSELFSVWRRNLVPDSPQQTIGRLKYRGEFKTLGEAFHYVESHIKERDQP